ncbi:MAG TPA: radical SAM protein [Phycisphaerae bacterium]|nr:radical SAM protein [Phycisphaerae bacterium]
MSHRPEFREHGKPTKSSWLFLGHNGGPCNKKCLHCFYAHGDHKVFFDLATLTAHANLFRHYYGCEATDITGGEPMMLPGLVDLVRHCANIGLAPSIITNGQLCGERRVKEIEDAGLDCWEFSLHGLGRLEDKALGAGFAQMVRRANGEPDGEGFGKLIHNADRCTRPRRWNCTVTGHTAPELRQWATFLVERYPPTVANFIQFMPYHGWGNQKPDFQWTYTKCAPYIADAIMALEGHGWEVNVRYFPFCVADQYGFARNCKMHYQIQYDPWEWAIEASMRTDMREVEQAGGVEAFRRRVCDNYAFGRRNETCDKCSARSICEGPDVQYQRRFGLEELKPFDGEQITDVNHFLHQDGKLLITDRLPGVGDSNGGKKDASVQRKQGQPLRGHGRKRPRSAKRVVRAAGGAHHK